MKFGLDISNMGPTAQWENIIRMARLAQELTFDSIWVSDHVFLPYRMETRYPYNDTGRLPLSPHNNIFDPLMTLAFIAGIVETPALGISVLIIPYRNPVVMTKMLTSLDVMSGGRVILGAGVGWMREEFETLGVSYQERGSITDECIQVFKELCTADEPYFKGKHYQLSNVGFYPKPVQKPHPPVWVGGYSLAAMRRAVRLGDGWNPSNIDPLMLAEKLVTLRRLSREAGRDPDGIEISIRVNGVGFGDDGTDSDGHVTPLCGTPQQMLDTLRRYEEAGVGHIVVGPRRSTIEEMAQTVERFAEEVRARL